MNEDIRAFREVLRRMERITLSRTKDTSYCCGVTVNQGHVLLCLESGIGLTLSELNSELRLDKATLSRTVDGLVKKGMVDRRENYEDRRFISLHLTREGEQFVEEINQVSLESFGQIYDRLEPHVRNRITDDLDDLVRAFREVDGVNIGCCEKTEQEMG